MDKPTVTVTPDEIDLERMSQRDINRIFDELRATADRRELAIQLVSSKARIAELEADNKSLGIALDESRQKREELEDEMDSLDQTYEALSKDCREYRDEAEAMAAHVELLKEGLHQALIHWGPHCTEEDGSAYAECEKRCDTSSQTSLAQRDEERFRRGFWWGFERARIHPDHYNIRSEYEDVLKLRQQAEGDEP